MLSLVVGGGGECKLQAVLESGLTGVLRGCCGNLFRETVVLWYGLRKSCFLMVLGLAQWEVIGDGVGLE